MPGPATPDVVNLDDDDGEMPAAQLTRLKAVFDSVDRDGNEVLSLREMEEAFAQLGLRTDHAHLRTMLVEADQNADGLLDFAEFAGLFHKARLRRMFHHLDADHSGYVDAEELRNALHALGFDSVDPEQIRTMLSLVDRNQDNRIDLDEFERFFEMIPAADLKSIARFWQQMAFVDCGSELAPSGMPQLGSHFGRALLAGGFAGAASRTFTAPLERVKIIAQTRTTAQSSLSIVREIIAKEGWRSLFRGNLVSCTRVIPFSATVCLAYSTLVGLIPTGGEFAPSEGLLRATAGATAGMTATLLTYPMDLLRTRLAASNPVLHESGRPLGAVALARDIVRWRGLRGLYSGIRPTLIAIAPFVAVQQATYDVLKLKVAAGFTPSVPLFLGCGTLAGIASQLAVHPIDMVRRNIQVSGSNEPHRGWAAVAHQVSRIWRRDGFTGFYRGWLPTVLKVAPSVGVSLLARDAALGRL